MKKKKKTDKKKKDKEKKKKLHKCTHKPQLIEAGIDS